jgi:hypothetical protein
MKKKWDDHGPGRKKVRKSRARGIRAVQSTALCVVQDMHEFLEVSKTAPVYPQVWTCLFGDVTGSGEVRKSNKRHASRTARNRIAEVVAEVVVVDEDAVNDVDRGDDHDFIPVEDNNSEEDVNVRFDINTPMPELPNVTEKESKMGELSFDPLQSPLIQTDSSTKPLISGSEGPKEESSTGASQETSTQGAKKKRRKRAKAPLANPKPIAKDVIVDICPIVEEIRAGRYPSMKPYIGDHSGICFLCKGKDKKIYNCEFCPKSEHLSCVQSKVIIRDPEPDDAFMCHRCIQTVLSRRARAEKRRLQKLDEARPNKDKDSTALSAKTAVAPEVVWDQAELDVHVASYMKCPSGGVGGLICCRHCTAAYSRRLVDTAKEMECQTVSGIGNEVSDLIELLHDAQSRLQQAVDVSNTNDLRRSLLSKDEVETDSGGYQRDEGSNNRSIMGIMDCFK